MNYKVLLGLGLGLALLIFVGIFSLLTNGAFDEIGARSGTFDEISGDATPLELWAQRTFKNVSPDELGGMDRNSFIADQQVIHDLQSKVSRFEVKAPSEKELKNLSVVTQGIIADTDSIINPHIKSELYRILAAFTWEIAHTYRPEQTRPQLMRKAYGFLKTSVEQDPKNFESVWVLGSALLNIYAHDDRAMEAKLKISSRDELSFIQEALVDLQNNIWAQVLLDEILREKNIRGEANSDSLQLWSALKLRLKAMAQSQHDGYQAAEEALRHLNVPARWFLI